VVVGGIVWSHLVDYDGDVVGRIVVELRAPSGISWRDVVSLLVPGLVIAVVGFAEPASIARRYAAEDRQPWDADKEFVGQGLANLASGAAGGFPVGGSFSRTSLNRISGARTRWSGFLTGLAVLAVLPFVDVLTALPVAVLSGLVIGAVVSLVDVRTPLRFWRWSKPQFAVGLVTVVSTLVLAPRVERGVLLGVAAALAVHLWREMRVPVPAARDDGVLHLHPHGVLYFGSVPAVERALNDEIAAHPDVDKVVLHLDAVGRLDLTGALMLRDLLGDAEAAGRAFEVVGAKAHAARLLRRVLGEDAPVTRRGSPE
jgi:SulP family sulfate permease